MRHKQLRRLTQGAITAALYVVLTYLTSLFGMASGVIQFRLSEALCIIACMTPAAIPGLSIGCLLSNFLTGAATLDVLLGPIATLIGTLGTWLLRRRPILAVIPPIAANMVVIPLVLRYGYGVLHGYWYLSLTVGVGEIVTCGVLGLCLYRLLWRFRRSLGFEDV